MQIMNLGANDVPMRFTDGDKHATRLGVGSGEGYVCLGWSVRGVMETPRTFRSVWNTKPVQKYNIC